MWSLILPDCRACDARKADSWKDKLCPMCRAEVELLEEQFSLAAIGDDERN